jgi:cell division protein FtsL
MSRRSNHPAAQSRALTRLTHEFRERFHELYAEEKANPHHSRIQSRAKTRLSLEFPQRYRELYLQEVTAPIRAATRSGATR